MHRIIAVLTALVTRFSMLAVPGPVQAQAKLTFKGQSSHPATSNFHLIFKLYAEQMEKMSGGRVKIGRAAGRGDRAAVRGIRRGLQGRAGRRHDHVRLHPGQEHRDYPDVARPAVRHGRRGLLGLVPARRRHAAAAGVLRRRAQAEHRRLSRADRLSAGPGMVQQADQEPCRPEGHEVPHLRHRRRDLQPARRGGGDAAGRRDRAGDGAGRDPGRRVDQLRGGQEARPAPGRQVLLLARHARTGDRRPADLQQGRVEEAARRPAGDVQGGSVYATTMRNRR